MRGSRVMMLRCRDNGAAAGPTSSGSRHSAERPTRLMECVIPASPNISIEASNCLINESRTLLLHRTMLLVP